MKTTLSVLMALGLVSQASFAQLQTSPPAGDPSTVSATDVTGPVSPSGSSGASADVSSGASGAMQSEAGAELRASESQTARLKPVTQDDVTYLCGGIGDEEVAYMKQEAKGYDLMLTFAARDGAYLADVDVDIKDARGNSVLQMACDAPILLVDLPRSGTYRVRAETAGYELNRSVKVNAGAKKRQRVANAVMTWPQQVAETAAGAATATGSSGGDSGSMPGSKESGGTINNSGAR